MRRYGRRKRKGIGSFISWALLCALLGWGGWQIYRMSGGPLGAPARRGAHAAPAHGPAVALAGEDYPVIKKVYSSFARGSGHAPEARRTPGRDGAPSWAQLDGTNSADRRSRGRTVRPPSGVRVLQMRGGAPQISRVAHPRPTVAQQTAALAGLFNKNPAHIDQQIAQGRALLFAGHVLRGRALLNTSLAELAGSGTRRAAALRRELRRLNRGFFFSPTVRAGDPCAFLIRVRPGATLSALARHYHISELLLKMMNPAVHWRLLRVGMALKVVRGPFNARVVAHAGRLELYARRMFVCAWPVRVKPYAVAMGRFHVVTFDQTLRLLHLDRHDRAAGACVALAPVRPGRLAAAGLAFFNDKRLQDSQGVGLTPRQFARLCEALTPQDSLIKIDP